MDQRKQGEDAMTAGGPRVAVVTGASSGIGKETAKALAARGWRVIASGRDADRCAAAEAEIRAAASGAEVEFLRADLSLLADARRLADEIAARTDRVDVLVNNAGGMASALVMTDEGYEGNFAANFLGPFVLTERLLPLLRAAAKDAPAGAVRIINTASDASEMIPSVNFADLQNLGNWSSGAAYCSGKLANVLHARALAGRLADDGIVAHAVHPGTVDSNFFSHTPDHVRDAYGDAPKLTNAEGADTLIWLATADAPGRSSGGYWHQRAPRAPNPHVDDPAYVARFWDEAEKLVKSPAQIA
ncbi:SDR family NAD(P)-dependent oxidoreductase [Novosphingobium album (ex Liu et al. 2023)]|uniref:SDR family NAD(P)-dependent oxidoreductase n=1 Tax=Novosphingobium album (ex Liu et al. 2023) TaxID=3031130 RepID=A0ABT5WL18_9SPHN|nr:SDR family NAD(P)-dependent oxidoreductase [Novosphingobium album (ex Liu et al. 2023)]MDE8650739.1 SDR family NAD(P)-dependent oxidoreductase [Novosphingobium album (ex Liu et al. 2023)]